MDNRKQVGDVDGLFRLINRMSAEADWNEDEVRKDIQASGVDPERLLSCVRSRLDEMLNSTSTDMLSEVKHFPLPLLGELKRLSKLSASEVARSLEVPLAFLSVVERHPEVVPLSWRNELANRAERALQIGKDIVLAIMDTPQRLEVATFNDRLSDQKLSYEDILEMSDMDESTKQFWLNLTRIS